MIKVLFICHGNICRSPMAEFVFRDMVEKRGLSDKICCASAATSSEELGHGVYPPVRALLAEHGIDCRGKKARQIIRQDYKDYDMIIGMDEANMRNMARVFGADPEGKLHMLMSFAGSSAAVADPWYTRDFEATWRDVNCACQALLRYIEENGLV